MNKKFNIRSSVLILMILAAALSRLLPHPHNFTPIGGMALFGAAYFSRKYLAFVVPLAAMWVSDLLLNNLVFAKLYPEFYQGFTWLGNGWVYLSFGLIVFVGFFALRQVRLTTLLGASLGASVLFFLVTNFGSWLGSGLYPANFPGLISAYAAAIPFFWNTLLGDLFYSGVLFGSFYWLSQKYPALQTSHV